MVYQTAKRVVVAVVGVTVLLLSIVGYILPIIPGIPLTFLGLAILATEFIWARRLLKKVKASAQDLMNKVTGNRPPESPEHRVAPPVTSLSPLKGETVSPLSPASPANPPG